MDASRPLVPVALGTALVLVTYVTPIATIPATAADLGAGPVARAWILSSMSVGLAGLLLASGVIGDALGRRRAYVVGLVGTAVGAVL
ncbi:MAG TPA: MFS transporter, partial [Nocardioides sp.]|nr:MFS transporter [Nocardioides sp.]